MWTELNASISTVFTWIFIGMKFLSAVVLIWLFYSERLPKVLKDRKIYFGYLPSRLGTANRVESANIETDSISDFDRLDLENRSNSISSQRPKLSKLEAPKPQREAPIITEASRAAGNKQRDLTST